MSLQEVISKNGKFKKSYIFYINKKYLEIVTKSIKSIREYSEIPILVYTIDFTHKFEYENVYSIEWDADLEIPSTDTHISVDGNLYIDRTNLYIYKLLINRPLITKDALENYSELVTYVDTDTIATSYVDNIFDMYDSNLSYPYFVESVDDWMHINGRGGAMTREDLSTTLEHPACELFNVNQYVRERYRQTAFYVAGQNTIPFLDEWYSMCIHPEVYNNFEKYAPFHEETLANVLLWKYGKLDGLPYIYANGGPDVVDLIYSEVEFKGPNIRNYVRPWLRVPESKDKLLFFHGEKNLEKLDQMIEKIRNHFVKYEYKIDPLNNWGDIISKHVMEHFSKQKLNKDDILHFNGGRPHLYKNGKILAIGSIMSFSMPNDYVWGSGNIINTFIGQKPKKIYAVRGPLTRELLLRKNIDCPEVYGDPSLLFPLIYNPEIKPKYKFGLIPHYIEFSKSYSLKIINHLKSIGVKVINITAGINEFIDELKEVEYVLSSSLHGLIAADAYNIPNKLVKISDLIHGGDFKYRDYFASVNRDYSGKYDITTKTTIEDIESLIYEVGDTSKSLELLDNAPWKDPECQFFNQELSNNKTRILFLAPHLSTGGMPSFLLKRIESLLEYGKDKYEVFVVEYTNLSPTFVVHKNRIKELLPPSNFFTLGENKFEVIDIIKNNKIDIIHLDEMIEDFNPFNPMPQGLVDQIYSNDRTWRVVETCHNVVFNPTVSKVYNPDAYAFCTPYHKEKTFKSMPSHGEVIEFPIENFKLTSKEKENSKKLLGLDPLKIHVVNVGLWTQGKNQGEGVEIARLFEKDYPEYQFHFIGNQASNFQSYWEPIMRNLPSNVKVWGERNDVTTFLKSSDIFMFNSTWECNPLVLREAASYGLKIISRNLPQYMNMFTPYINLINNDITKTKDLILSLKNKKVKRHLSENTTENFYESHMKLYDKVLNMFIRKNNRQETKVSVEQRFVGNPFLEIKGESDKKYLVEFFDENNNLIYSNTISSNSWVKLNRQYYTKWRTTVKEDGKLIYENDLDFEGKRVYIVFDSSSLGDTIAWIPYCLEFKKKHKCDVIVSTFKNDLFKNVYPELEFVYPGSKVTNIYAMYKIGWFYDSDREPVLPNTIPLQKAASNILGLEYSETPPRISFNPTKKPYEGKYVTIAPNSTAGCKHWTKEGWQTVINYLNENGYKVINVSKEDTDLTNIIKLTDTSLNNTMNVIHHSEVFIGLSSGLSWLSWSIGKHVIMISNFTEEDHEFTSNCTRITNKSVCHGCWNNPNFKFDKSDWNWCPIFKNTKKHFECHKSITSDDVIQNIQHLLK